MLRVLFQAVSVLVEYNMGLTSALVKHEEIDEIYLETSQLLVPILGWRRLLSARKVRLAFFPFFLRKSLYPRLARLSEIVHLNSTRDTCTKVALKLNKPKIFTLHEKPIKSVLETIIDEVDTLVVPSRFLADEVRTKLGFDPIIVHHGVDRRIFDTTIPQRIARSKLNLPPTSKIVLWNGRLTPQKDPMTFLKAVSIISEHYRNDILFFIKGRAADRQYYHEVSKKMKNLAKESLQEKIILNSRWLPYWQLPYLYRSADVLVHTAVYESFGLVFVEAMACGTPVIAADAATASEILGEAGVLYNLRDPHDLAEKVVTLLGDDKLRRNLSLAGVKRIEKCGFTWGDAAKEYASLYESLL